MTIAIFANCAFFLRVKKLTILEKNRLKNCIQENGGQIKFVLNQKCTHVVTDDANALSLTHLKAIQKYQLPIVGPDFIWNSVKERRLLQTDNYEPSKSLAHITGAKWSLGHGDNYQREKDATVKNDKNETSGKNESNDSDNMGGLRCFSNNDENLPYFPEDFEIAKYDILEKVAAYGEYVIVELQCFQQQCDYPFRIHVHYSVRDGHQLQKQIIPAKTSEEARRIYVLCIEDLKKEDFQLRKDFPSEAEYLASGKLQEMLLAEAVSSSTFSEEVAKFVELIWIEALGHLNLLLDKPLSSISLNDVSRAEGVLLRMKKALNDMKSQNELSAMMIEFYKIIPHKGGLNCNVNMKLLSNQQDLCQLIRDMLNVQETNMSIPNPSSLSKYRALRCRIDALDENTEEFHKVKQQVDQNPSECPVKILQIYKVGRITEAANFQSHLGNVQSLIHGSSPGNFVGILSRGLLLPKMAVEEHGLERTDCGNLGSGIYFNNSISMSIKYSQPSRTDGARLLVVCDVALGTCWDTCQTNSSLAAAPSGYDSVHGVSKKKNSDSAFEDDEFVVYKTSQVKIKYVVKFSLAYDRVKEFHPIIQAQSEDQVPSPDQAQPEDYQIPSQDLLNNITAGLLDRSGNPIPLKDVHIKGKIIDFVAQIVVFQTYENHTGSPIEAKYVFPLDDTAAVCGFEAFIKGKHIIGEVKEKEKAHQEYRDALSRGDGAYLMDQDTPDIFTVSVGNLPPSTKVLIKITYITELGYKDGCLFFHLPAAVAPWQQDKALSENTQESVRKVTIKQVGTKAGEFSLQMSVEMPFKINDIRSWTHQLKIKKTDCKAVVLTIKGSSLDTSGFAMEIVIGDVHLPRMWVEKHPDKKSEACMLVFQPEFEAPLELLSTHGETIICLDCSNSMAGSEIQQAKQIALCFLDSFYFTDKLTVIKFGTNFVEFPYNSEDFKVDYTALKEFIISATATMGNSDLWKTLHYLSLLYPSEGKRNILLISDGHIQNEAMTLQLVKKNAKHTRIFTCGVGPTANRHMLRSLSQYGAGAFEHFDAKSKYNWERKVRNQKTRMSSPGCNAISIKWQQFDTDAPELMYAPAQIQSLFNHERLLVYGFISNCTQATLHALVDSQELQTMVSTTELQKTTGTMLHKLAARAFIRDYEQGILHENETEHEMKKQLLKSMIIKLSLENSIVTQFTSFVAIEKRNEKEDQIVDTLDVLELVSKEDVDILPYMQYLEPEEEESFLLETLSEEMLKKTSLQENICLEDSADLGIQLTFLPQAHLKLNEADFLSSLDALFCDSSLKDQKLSSQKFVDLQPAASQISDTSSVFPRLPYGSLHLDSTAEEFSAPKMLMWASDPQSFPPPPPPPPPPPSAEYKFSSSSLMGQKMSSLPTTMSGPDATLNVQNEKEDQIVDTLDVLELVSKEDVDILPYMQYLEPEEEESFLLETLSEEMLKKTSLQENICLEDSADLGIQLTFLPQAHLKLNEADFLSSLDALFCDSSLKDQKLSSQKFVDLQPAASQISDTSSVFPRLPYGSLHLDSTAEEFSAPKMLMWASDPQSFPPPPPPPPPPPSAEYKFSSSSLMGQKMSSLPTTMSGPDATLNVQLSDKPILPTVFGFGSLQANAPSGRWKPGGSLSPPPPLLPLTGTLLSQKKLIPQSGLFGSTHLPGLQAIPAWCGLPPRTAAYDRKQLIPEHPPAVQLKQDSELGTEQKQGKAACKKKKVIDKEGLASEDVHMQRKILPDRKLQEKWKSETVHVWKPLSALFWPRLFQLQNKEDGFWQLTPELGLLLDLDVDHLVNVTLAKKGIQSLGPKGKEKLLQLIATLLVLQAVRFNQLGGLIFKSLTKLNDSPPSWAFYPVKKAVEWTRKTEREFPAICQRLELGKDWDSATRKMLRIDVIGTFTSPL